jgi:hypothetical protein
MTIGEFLETCSPYSAKEIDNHLMQQKSIVIYLESNGEVTVLKLEDIKHD